MKLRVCTKRGYSYISLPLACLITCKLVSLLQDTVNQICHFTIYAVVTCTMESKRKTQRVLYTGEMESAGSFWISVRKAQ